MSKIREVSIYFTNGRMVKLPEEKVSYVRLAAHIDEEYKPDIANGKAVVNWDNVAFVREWIDWEDEDE